VSTRSDVLLWARRVIAKKGSAPHLVLELPANASLDDAQKAFHKIARSAHPDLHRNNLAAEELEMVTQAYSAAAAAYQTFRAKERPTMRMNPLKDAPGAPASAVPVTPGGAAPAGLGPATQMSSKALVYYRKAELALKRGDLAGAVLSLKMAIAADPQSAFLRTALAEVQTEVTKGS
jgi:hypothetical protein